MGFCFQHFTEKANHALHLGFVIASQLGHTYVGTEHLLYGLSADVGSVAGMLLSSSDITPQKLQLYIAANIGRGMKTNLQAEQLSPRIREVMHHAMLRAKEMGREKVGTEDLFLVILKDKTCGASCILRAMQADTGTMLADLSRAGTQYAGQIKRIQGNVSAKSHTTIPYTTDMTAEAAKYDPLIGREEELNRMIRILARRSKNNPCLVGEPGVGKTALAEGLARWMASGKAAPPVGGKRLLSLDLSAMLAGAKYRGDFEERVKNVMEQVSAAGDIILFVDELHNIIGTGAAEGAIDAANILKPALSRGKIQLIGATTPQDYRRVMQKDGALERRFQQIEVAEPTKEQAIAILEGLKPTFERYHHIIIGTDAIRAAVECSIRCLPDRFLPDKAVDLLDEAAARLHLSAPDSDSADSFAFFEMPIAIEKPVLCADDIHMLASEITGIPVSSLQADMTARAAGLEAALLEDVKGQDHAVATVAAAVRRSYSGLRETTRPIASFLFLGETGVGKTELCRSLSRHLFDNVGKNAFLKLDMSEFMEKHSVARLIGAPPGYVGTDDGGQLTNAVAAHPHMLIVFDEIEKAHPEVFDLLLQILEDGTLTDARGKKVSFAHTLIVLTSNVKTAAGKVVGFGAENRGEANVMLDSLKTLFRPELLGRLDDIIRFEPLNDTVRRKIAWKFIDAFSKRAKKCGIAVRVSEKVVDALISMEKFGGARSIRGNIVKYLETPLSDAMIEGSMEGMDLVCYDVGENNQIQFTCESCQKV